jgi:hypothetical protein
MKFKRFYRHPRTRQERRAFFAAVEQNVRIRAARSPRHLPTDWDDKPVHRTSFERAVLRGELRDWFGFPCR